MGPKSALRGRPAAVRQACSGAATGCPSARGTSSRSSGARASTARGGDWRTPAARQTQRMVRLHRSMQARACPAARAEVIVSERMRVSLTSVLVAPPCHRLSPCLSTPTQIWPKPPNAHAGEFKSARGPPGRPDCRIDQLGRFGASGPGGGVRPTSSRISRSRAGLWRTSGWAGGSPGLGPMFAEAGPKSPDPDSPNLGPAAALLCHLLHLAARPVPERACLRRPARGRCLGSRRASRGPPARCCGTSHLAAPSRQAPRRHGLGASGGVFSGESPSV